MSAMTYDIDELAPIGPLTDWLDAEVPQLGKGPLTTAILSGGTSSRAARGADPGPIAAR